LRSTNDGFQPRALVGGVAGISPCFGSGSAPTQVPAPRFTESPRPPGVDAQRAPEGGWGETPSRRHGAPCESVPGLRPRILPTHPRPQTCRGPDVQLVCGGYGGSTIHSSPTTRPAGDVRRRLARSTFCTLRTIDAAVAAERVSWPMSSPPLCGKLRLSVPAAPSTTFPCPARLLPSFSV